MRFTLSLRVGILILHLELHKNILTWLTEARPSDVFSLFPIHQVYFGLKQIVCTYLSMLFLEYLIILEVSLLFISFQTNPISYIPLFY